MRTNQATLCLLEMRTKEEGPHGAPGEEFVEELEVVPDRFKGGEDESHAVERVPAVTKSASSKHDPFTTIRDTGQLRALVRAILDGLIDAGARNGIGENRTVEFVGMSRCPVFQTK